VWQAGHADSADNRSTGRTPDPNTTSDESFNRRTCSGADGNENDATRSGLDVSLRIRVNGVAALGGTSTDPRTFELLSRLGPPAMQSILVVRE
jgi:hypothetical protein